VFTADENGTIRQNAVHVAQKQFDAFGTLTDLVGNFYHFIFNHGWTQMNTDKNCHGNLTANPR
jgi:hypothetical protein